MTLRRTTILRTRIVLLLAFLLVAASLLGLVFLNFMGTLTTLAAATERSLSTASPTAPATFHGIDEETSCQKITGWAWDSSRPDTPVDVDILDGSAMLTTVPANEFGVDLVRSGIGNGKHLFSYRPPVSLKDGQTHSIQIMFAGTETALNGSPRLMLCANTVDSLDGREGNHDAVNCKIISGWAWDSTLPKSPIDVDIYDSSRLLTTVPANQFRPDLLSAGDGDGRHGFILASPTILKDGQAHWIHGRIAGTGIDLQNPPPPIICPPEQKAALNSTPVPTRPAFQGRQERIDCRSIHGWAWEPTSPDMPVTIEIYDGPMLLAKIPANQPRQDLRVQGKGNGEHGFEYPLPNALKDGRPHSVGVRIVGTDFELRNSPQSITCPTR
jgi:hypothetical protein